MRWKKERASDNCLIRGIIPVLAILFISFFFIPGVIADDMVSVSDSYSSGAYLEIDISLDQDVLNIGDSIYIMVTVMEEGYPVEGAYVQLTSTHTDNVTIEVVQDHTDMEGQAIFTLTAGEVSEDKPLLINSIASYNGHEAALDSILVTILADTQEIKPPEVIKEKENTVEPIDDVGGEVIVIGASAILVLSVSGAIATEVGKYALLKLAFPLYSRMKKEEVLDHFVRGQIYGHIMSHPGSHYNAIKKELKVTNGTLSHHLKTLELQGFIKSHRDGTYKRFYPLGVKHAKNKGIRLSDLQLSIIDCLRQTEGITQSEIAASLGMSQQSISYNLNILVRKEIIRFERSGVKKHYFINDEAA